MQQYNSRHLSAKFYNISMLNVTLIITQREKERERGGMVSVCEFTVSYSVLSELYYPLWFLTLVQCW